MDIRRLVFLGCVLLAGSVPAFAAESSRTVDGQRAPGSAPTRPLGAIVTDDADWTPLGETGFISSSIYAVTAGGGNVYVGGGFTESPDGPANRVAKWDGSTWTALGGGMDDNVLALAWDGTHLYAGGAFTHADGKPANHVAVWDGNEWNALGDGASGVISALLWNDGTLYAGGTGVIAQWDGQSWSSLGSILLQGAGVLALAWSDGILYAGGDFESISLTPRTLHIAQWDGSTWSALGDGLLGNLVWDVTTGGSRVYAALDDYVLQWDGEQWTTAGRVTGDARLAFALLWDGRRLYAGGSFTSIDGIAANNMALLDGGSWTALGSGTGDRVYRLAWDGRRVIAVGEFFQAGNQFTNVAAFSPPEIFYNGFE